MRHISRALAATALAVAFVVVSAPAAWAIQIFVEPPSGPLITLEVETSDTIENVTQKVHDKTGITADRQQLIFNGVPLENGQILSDYNVQNNDTVQLVPRVPLAFSTLTLPSFFLDAPYTGSVLATGGFGPSTYSVTAGALPDGISLDPTTGALSGTPRTAGPWSFTITADALGVTATQAFSGTVAPQLAATGVEPAPVLGVAALLLLVGTLLFRRPARAATPV